MRGTQYYVSGPRLIRAVVSAVYKARSIESLARRAAGHANSSVPVVVIEGNSEPQVHGASYWKTNWSNGHGFSKTLYTPSTQHITVGALWSPWDWSEV